MRPAGPLLGHDQGCREGQVRCDCSFHQSFYPVGRYHEGSTDGHVPGPVQRLDRQSLIVDLGLGFRIVESYFFQPERHSMLRLFATTVGPLGNAGAVPGQAASVALLQRHSRPVADAE